MIDTTPDAANVIFERWQRSGRVQWLAMTLAFEAPAEELAIMSRLIFCDLHRELTGQSPALPTPGAQAMLPLYGDQGELFPGREWGSV